MSADRILMLKLLGDTSSMDKSLRKSEGTLRSFGRSVARWGVAGLESLAIDGFGALTDAVSDAWDGFREGQKVADQLGVTWKNLGLDGQKLDGTLQQIYDSTLALGTSDDEAVQAFNNVLKATGNSREAMKRLRIAQDLVANGSAPNLQSALKLIQQASKGSWRAVDQFGLKSKTAAGRVDELGQKVKGAAKHKADLDPLGVLFNRIGEDLEGIVGGLASGKIEDALKSIGQIATDTADAWDKIDQKITPTLNKLSGGKWSEAQQGASGLQSDLQGLEQRFLAIGGPALDQLTGSLRSFGDLLSTLQPWVQTAITALQPLNDFFLTQMSGAIGLFVQTGGDAFATITALLRGDFSTAWNDVGTLIGNVLGNVDKMFGKIPSTLLGILPDLADAAGQVGGTIYDAIIGWLRNMANRAVEIWNSIGSFGAGSFQLIAPQHVTILGQTFGWDGVDISWGAGDLIPNISVPKFGSGGIVSSPTLAMIGERGPEAVVPLSRGGGMGNTYNIAVHVAPGGDLVEAGRQMVRAIQQYERRSGKVWRAA